MEVKLDREGRFPVVRISGDMRLWGKQGMADSIRETVLEALRGNRLVLMNLAGATHVDSRGIGCIARCLSTALAHESEMRLVVPPGPIRQVLQDVHILAVFPVYEDETSATQDC